MTNFEKWKSALTIDDIVSAVNGDLEDACRGCPIRGKCDINNSCEEELRAWAQTEVEEGAEQ